MEVDKPQAFVLAVRRGTEEDSSQLPQSWHLHQQSGQEQRLDNCNLGTHHAIDDEGAGLKITPFVFELND